MRRFLALTFLGVIWSLSCGDYEEGRFTASAIVEGTSVNVAALTGGRLLEVPVQEGDRVEAGQTVAVVDSEKLTYQLEQVEAGLQEIAVQRTIQKNAVEIARTRFENAEAKYQRFLDLYQKASASRQAVDDLQAAYDAAKNQLENARQNLQLMQSKERALRAQRKLLKRQMADAVIAAPIAGTVATQYFEAGETVPTGAPVVEIINLDELWSKVYVSEMLLPKIQLGQTADVRIDGTERRLQGRVTWISPKAEFTPKNILTEETRTSLVYAVKITIDNKEQLLKHGMPVEITLTLGS